MNEWMIRSNIDGDDEEELCSSTFKQPGAKRRDEFSGLSCMNPTDAKKKHEIRLVRKDSGVQINQRPNQL